MYDRAIKEGMDDFAATEYAEEALKHFMTTPLAADKALFVSHNSRGLSKVFSMFTHPATVHFSNIPMIGGKVSKYHTTLTNSYSA